MGRQKELQRAREPLLENRQSVEDRQEQSNGKITLILTLLGLSILISKGENILSVIRQLSPHTDLED